MESRDIGALIHCIRLPLLVAVANALVGSTLWVALPGAWGTAGSVALRLALMVWAGWLVTRNRVGGLGVAAVAAALVPFLDHVVVTGGWFLVQHLIDPVTIESVDYPGLEHRFDRPMPQHLLAFGGVLVSYVMFSPVYVMLGVIGGLLGRTSDRGGASADDGHDRLDSTRSGRRCTPTPDPSGGPAP